MFSPLKDMVFKSHALLPRSLWKSYEEKSILSKIVDSGLETIEAYCCYEEVGDLKGGALILWHFAVPLVIRKTDQILKLMGDKCPSTTTNLLHEEDTRPAEEKMRMASDEIIKIVETVRKLDSEASPSVAGLKEIVSMARRVQKLVEPVLQPGGMSGSLEVCWLRFL